MAKSRKTPQRYLVIPEVKIACSDPQDALGYLLYQALVDDDLLRMGIGDDSDGSPFRFSAQERKALTAKGIPLQLLELLEKAYPMLANNYTDLGSLCVVEEAQAWELILAFDWAALPVYQDDQVASIENLGGWLNGDSLNISLNLKSMLPILQHPILTQVLQTSIAKMLPGYEKQEQEKVERKRRGTQQEIRSAMLLLEANGYTLTAPAPVFKKAAKPRKSAKK